jgi:formylglycine-generating enzyme required for sulfatase activity
VVTGCASGYLLSADACLGSLGAACTLNAECASGFCATGPDGTANDRCAPEGMNYIPAGTFTMGSPVGELGRGGDEEPHSVTLSRSFFLGQTEVTQGQWKARSGGTNPSYFQSTTGSASSTANANDNGPVEQVDWNAAVAFANAKSTAAGLTPCYILTGCTDAANGWKDGIHSGCTGATFSGLTCSGYRLPTESEWEYAARAGTTGVIYNAPIRLPAPRPSSTQSPGMQATRADGRRLSARGRPTHGASSTCSATSASGRATGMAPTRAQ